MNHRLNRTHHLHQPRKCIRAAAAHLFSFPSQRGLHTLADLHNTPMGRKPADVSSSTSIITNISNTIIPRRGARNLPAAERNGKQDQLGKEIALCRKKNHSWPWCRRRCSKKSTKVHFTRRAACSRFSLDRHGHIRTTDFVNWPYGSTTTCHCAAAHDESCWQLRNASENLNSTARYGRVKKAEGTASNSQSLCASEESVAVSVSAQLADFSATLPEKGT